MIPKHIEMRNTDKSSIVRLIEYITSTQGKEHRVDGIFTCNCRYEDPDLISREMLITQLKNTRSQVDKTYHLLLSFRPGEDPESDVIKSSVKSLCDELGFGEHQYLAAVHRDTDNVHVHVAINKIHPTRFTVHSPYMDHLIMGNACDELEERFHLQHDNHTPTGKTKTERKAQDIEAMTGQESFLTWLRRECLPEMRAATTWDELHRTLAKYGLTLALQNNGVVISIASGERIKGSGLDRSFSKANLEKRLGPFQPRSPECDRIPLEKHYTRDPIGPPSDLGDGDALEYLRSRKQPVQKTEYTEVTPEKSIALNDEYENLREANYAAKSEAIDRTYDMQRRKTAALLAEIRLDRLRVRRFPISRLTRQKLYETIKKKYRAKLNAIRSEADTERQHIQKTWPRLEWTAWVQQQAAAGREEAIQQMRSRAYTLAKKIGNAITGEEEVPGMPFDVLAIDSITNNGTFIYRVGAEAVRDDGRSLRIARAASMDTAIMALQIAKKRFGKELTICGTDEFRDSIVKAAVEGEVFVRFADPILEKKCKQLRYQQQTHTQQQRTEHDKQWQRN